MQVPTPRYRELVDLLRAQILSGELEPGERLPSVRTLAERHRMSPAMVSKAIDVLEAQGLVRPITGSGVYVRSPEDTTITALVARLDDHERRIRELERRHDRADRDENGT